MQVQNDADLAQKSLYIAGQVKCWFTRTNSCVSASIRRPCHAENISSASVNLYHFRSETTIPFDLGIHKLFEAI